MKLDSKESNRPRRKSLCVQLGVALALTTTTLGAQAAGLGRLNVLSSIGQPLRAEIDLTAVGSDEAQSLTVRLASADAFGQASVDYSSALKSLRFSIQRHSNGQPFVLVTSNQILNEPFLDVLVELSWSSGRLVREYTLLMDPPDSRTAQRQAEPATTTVLPAQAPPVSRRGASRSATRGTGAGSASIASARVATPAAGSASDTPGGNYVVKSGDTASSISRDNKADGVTLEQMLAALYRDNPGAFNGNINRLTAGATMKLPDAATAQAIDSGEARRIVAQSSNFGSYRERIARNAAVVPNTRSSGQQASGKLTTQVEDSAAPTGDAKDRLQLSRPDATKTAGTGSTGARTGAPATGEEVAAKDRELFESRSRVALLEKNVADLQKLLDMKSQTLADLQKGAAGKSADVGAAVVTPPKAATAAATTAANAPGSAPGSAPPAAASTSVTTAPSTTPPVMTAPAATAPTNAPTTAPTNAPTNAPTPAADATLPPAAVAPTPVPVPVAPVPAPVKAAPPPVVAQNWYDGLLDNTGLVVGLVAIVLLLIGYGVFTARRRRNLSGFEDSIFVDNSVLHANSVFGTTGGQSVDTANSGFHSNFVPVAGVLPEQNEVDPVAEADVYIAYGRDAQAEEILKEALRADGSRNAVRLKLLEIYAKRGDAKTFETMASELYAATGGQGQDWKQAAELGLTLDPHNPLYGETPATSPESLGVVPATMARVPTATRNASTLGTGLVPVTNDFISTDLNEEPAEMTGTQIAAATSFAGHAKTDPLPRAEPLAATSAPSMNLDFDLGFASTSVNPLPSGAAPEAAVPVAPPKTDKDNGLDFDVGAGKSMIEPFSASAFGSGDASARTAVNLPAFRARADKEPPPAPVPRPDADGFTASDIFGTSIIADANADALYGETAPAPPAPTPTPALTPAQARTQDFRNALDNNQFDKTEPFEAFSKINLDLDQDGYDPNAGGTDFGAKTDIWQAMATKLDLALAYSDIGDKDGARELLEEVVRNGDTTQAERARTLMSELG